MNWCIPPIRWLQRWVVPPDSPDWAKVAFQPMLYLAVWIGAILYLTIGDVTAIDKDLQGGMSNAWLSLSLICPPVAWGSLHLITHGTGAWKYRGFWLALGADIGQFTALLIYTVQKFGSGDYHVYSVTTLVAIVVFVMHLVMRDVKRLRQVEALARTLHRSVS